MATQSAPDRVAEQGGSFSRAVQRMFDGLAPRYDAFNRWASLGLDRRWRRVAVAELGLPPGARVLDVATGTGDLALAAAAAGARVTGVDFAPSMLRRARAKAAASGRALAVQVARAEALPFAGAAFDGVVSAFAMRNVRPFLDDVLGEMARVLRPGGRVAILEFSAPRAPIVRFGHALYTRGLVPLVGRMLTGEREPFDYLNRSIDAWDAPERFGARLARAGFAGVRFRLLSFGTVAVHSGTRR